MTDVEAKREINRMINEAWCAGEVRCVERDARGEGLRWQGMTVRDPRTVTNRTELIDRYRGLESRISEFAEQVLAECVEIDNASLDELLAKAEFRGSRCREGRGRRAHRRLGRTIRGPIRHSDREE